MDTTLFKLPKGCYAMTGGQRMALTAFALRECDGDDEEKAANLAKAKGGSATAMEELIQLSLTSVNGEPVNQGKPYLGFTKWNSRARQFAAKAWNSINAVDEKEGDAFLAAAVCAAEAPAAG